MVNEKGGQEQLTNFQLQKRGTENLTGDADVWTKLLEDRKLGTRRS
jgi:hypothetical protein